MKQVKILCLHGLGESGAIFRAQTATLRSLLPKHFTLIFAEGPHLCTPLSDDIAHVFPGPYRCWYTSPSVTRMAAAQAAVQAIIDSHGPFDLVMGFSQGAAVAASLLLHDEIERRGASVDQAVQGPLFRGAVFICSPLPFSKDLAHGIDARSEFGIAQIPTLENLGWGANRITHVPSTLLPSDERFLIPDDQELTAYYEETDLHGTSWTGPFYQMFHTSADDVRISIPTAHIMGRRDKLWGEHSKALAQLCDERSRIVYDFYGGHEIPRDKDVLADICDVIVALAA